MSTGGGGDEVAATPLLSRLVLYIFLVGDLKKGADGCSGRSNDILLARTDVPNVSAKFATLLLTGGGLRVLVFTDACDADFSCFKRLRLSSTFFSSPVGRSSELSLS